MKNRSEKLRSLIEKYDIYNFKKHKGYPTKEHIELLNKYGPIKGLYRYSYKPVQLAALEKISYSTHDLYKTSSKKMVFKNITKKKI